MLVSCLLFSSIIASTGDGFLQSFTDICFVCITSTHLCDVSSFSSLSQVNKGPGHKLNLNIKYLCQESVLCFLSTGLTSQNIGLLKTMLILPRLHSVSAVCLPDIKQQLSFPPLLLTLNEIRMT